MRVILVFIAAALALPAFAESSPPEVILPDTPEEVCDSAARMGELDDALGVVEGVADDPSAKENNSQCDEPDGPPCEGGG